jgi:hypothetical protein
MVAVWKTAQRRKSRLRYIWLLGTDTHMLSSCCSELGADKNSTNRKGETPLQGPEEMGELGI